MEYQATTGEQVKKIAGGNVRIVLYPQIEEYRTLGQLLEPYGSIIILYMTGNHFGHWVSLFKRPDNVVEFFDSYGYRPDMELSFTDPRYNSYDNTVYPFILRLLYENPLPVDYSEHHYQSKRKGISTCGRWAAMRVRYKSLNVEQFWKYIKKLSDIMGITDKDKLISIISQEYE